MANVKEPGGGGKNAREGQQRERDEERKVSKRRGRDKKGGDDGRRGISARWASHVGALRCGRDENGRKERERERKREGGKKEREEMQKKKKKDLVKPKGCCVVRGSQEGREGQPGEA